jgi:CHAD domain-containing protein
MGIADDSSAAQSSGVAVQSALDTSARRLLASADGARAGDVESVHQMRVAVRRLRSDLRTFRPLIEPSWASVLMVDLKWLGEILGALRDLDVLIARLERRRTGLKHALALEPLLRCLGRRHEQSKARLHEALDSDRYADLAGRLVGAACGPELTAAAVEGSDTALPRLVARAWKKLARAGRALRDDDPVADYHRVRILAKRARYAAEAVAPALRGGVGRQAYDFASAAAGVQAVLGEQQDAVMARAELRKVLSTNDPGLPAARVATRLLRVEKEASKAARRRFPKAWKRLDRKKLRRWLRP